MQDCGGRVQEIAPGLLYFGMKSKFPRKILCVSQARWREGSSSAHNWMGAGFRLVRSLDMLVFVSWMQQKQASNPLVDLIGYMPGLRIAGCVGWAQVM